MNTDAQPAHQQLDGAETPKDTAPASSAPSDQQVMVPAAQQLSPFEIKNKEILRMGTYFGGTMVFNLPMQMMNHNRPLTAEMIRELQGPPVFQPPMYPQPPMYFQHPPALMGLQLQEQGWPSNRNYRGNYRRRDDRHRHRCHNCCPNRRNHRRSYYHQNNSRGRFQPAEQQHRQQNVLGDVREDHQGVVRADGSITNGSGQTDLTRKQKRAIEFKARCKSYREQNRGELRMESQGESNEGMEAQSSAEPLGSQSSSGQLEELVEAMEDISVSNDPGPSNFSEPSAPRSAWKTIGPYVPPEYIVVKAPNQEPMPKAAVLHKRQESGDSGVGSLASSNGNGNESGPRTYRKKIKSKNELLQLTNFQF
ncbi:Protein CBG28114 [Caenorhabditis briggsae]|uniref:Protein CBG28114 n=2 Tax=Caenorhabditis briggsae TaxID=6238 RepID=B6IGV3_CAEBR|nr:Protein CBG28114 [Caenorhabditis briggsae]ULT85056.1 hypothetical protein L3Y34_013624 [Caenorhabditis briggsae]CAR99133.1 Protein CBG28114 [Caenorhabditis briggsae]